MSVGLPVDKTTLDQRAGQLAWNLRTTFEQIKTVKTWLDSMPDATLEAAPFGYAVGEVATLKSAFTDLNNLASIAHAQGTQAQANDFFFFANKLTGLQ